MKNLNKEEELRLKAINVVYMQINKLIQDLKAKNEKLEKGATSVTINGDVYVSEEEVQDAYGCGCITYSQMNNAIKRFRGSNHEEQRKELHLEWQILDDFMQQLYEQIEKLTETGLYEKND